MPAVIGLTVCLAGCAAPRSKEPAAGAGSVSGAAAIVLTRNLEEEMYFVDVIVRGTVLETGESFSRLFSKVTPSRIRVDDVIHGDPDEDVITLYQHGTPDTDQDHVLVSPGEDVILLLMDTTDDFYWPYDSGAGVWKVKKGRVTSGPSRLYGKVEPHLFDKLQNMKVETFIKKIRKAANNKKRPEDDGEGGLTSPICSRTKQRVLPSIANAQHRVFV